MEEKRTLDPAAAVAHIKACKPNSLKFIIRSRGTVDWKFGELAEYIGYEAARAEVEHKRRMWYDWEEKYSDCLLNTTYTAFLEAEQQLNQPHPVG